MELSDQLIEALDAVVFTWSKPRTGDSHLNAHLTACQVLEQLDEDYGDADPNEVIPDLVNEMLARSGESDVWLGRTAALGCVIEATMQAEAAERASRN